MNGIPTLLVELAKNAGPFAAVAELIAVVVLWRVHRQDQKALWDLNRTILAITRESTKAMLANARAMARMSAKMERGNGR